MTVYLNDRKSNDALTHGIVHAGFRGLRAFVARKKSQCKLIGNRLVIPHDTIPSTVMGQLKKTAQMRIVLFILTLFCILTTFAENKLARIKDSDGYTNIRSGQGNEFSIVSTFEKDELFYCDLTNTRWVKVLALKWQDGIQIEGYIHNSRIQLIETLDLKSKQELLTQVLSKQKSLADTYQRAFKSKDSLGCILTRRELETHSDCRYSPVLDILPIYFCETKDTVLLHLFFLTIWADSGSANELPSIAIGVCYICQTDLVARQTGMIKNREQRQIIYSNIEWGIVNHYAVDEEGKSMDEDFNRLKKRLDNERKEASP